MKTALERIIHMIAPILGSFLTSFTQIRGFLVSSIQNLK